MDVREAAIGSIAGVEVRIGVVHTPKELAIELESVDDVINAIEQAVKDGVSMIWLTDTKGRRVGVPLDKLAYVEVDAEEGSKRVGFGRL